VALTLSLLRHAKSSRDDATLADFDRPLSERGQRDAPRMGTWLASASVPELVLCSTARRTQQTLALMRPALPATVKVKLTKTLYLAEANVLVKAVRAAPPEVRHVLLIGHNPGLEDMARELIGKGDAALRAALATKFPSAGCAVVTFEAKTWREIGPGQGTLVRWMTPKTLST
jgi:phosphohistidine phosphatase